MGVGVRTRDGSPPDRDPRNFERERYERAARINPALRWDDWETLAATKGKPGPKRGPKPGRRARVEDGRNSVMATRRGGA